MSTEQMQQSAAGEVQEVWTYQGRRISSDGKLMYEWRNGQDTDLWFAKNIVRHASVGQTYRVTLDAERRIWTKGPKAPVFDIYLSDDARVAAWRRQDHLAQTVVDAERARKRAETEHKGDLGLMTLEEAHRWYSKRLSSDQRSAVLAVLIRFLQFGY